LTNRVGRRDGDQQGHPMPAMRFRAVCCQFGATIGSKATPQGEQQQHHGEGGQQQGSAQGIESGRASPSCRRSGCRGHGLFSPILALSVLAEREEYTIRLPGSMRDRGPVDPSCRMVAPGRAGGRPAPRGRLLLRATDETSLPPGAPRVAFCGLPPRRPATPLNVRRGSNGCGRPIKAGLSFRAAESTLQDRAIHH